MRDAKKSLLKSKVSFQKISQELEGQRIDNYLISKLKGVPKTHIYRLLRKGEVRVNKKRIDASYKLNHGDLVRIPPLFLAEKGLHTPPTKATIELLLGRILYEDDRLLILNKPANLSVHAGSTVRMGIIEILKYHYPKLPHLELAHRLDSETTGCLIIAKKRSILKEVHALLREGAVKKTYWALTKGHFSEGEHTADFALHKHYRHGGKHVVEVNTEGKSALTHFKPLTTFKEAQLTEALLETGRTHQIRVHAAHLNHPIAGDDRYGDANFNKLVHQLGLRRMFLHAREVEFTLPSQGQHIRVVAPLDPELEAILTAFKSQSKA